MPRRMLALCLIQLALLPVALTVRAEDTQAARRQEVALKRYRAYLARKPFHDWAFDKLVEAAVGRNALEGLVKAYEASTKEDPDDLAGRVVLARLYARTDQRERALRSLAELKVPAKQRPSWLSLRGALHLRLQQPKLALEVLEQAASELAKALRPDLRVLGAIQRRRGEAALAAGHKERAVDAFRALARLEPKSLNARLEAARLLSDNGLLDEALGELAEAKRLAGNKTAKRCRVLAEMGQLQERRLQIPQALATYREAIGLMGRGNWLARDLRGRLLAIHKRGGKLEELIAHSESDAKAHPGDLARREFLAEVLEAADRAADARALLEAAVKDFPRDLALSRRLLALLRGKDSVDARIAEYQRILTHHPAELELHVELGQVFAASGRSKAARRQWQSTLRERLQDPALCLRLAELHQRFEQFEDAVALYRRAIKLRPKDTGPVGDLARLLVRCKKEPEVLPLLEAAATAVASDAGALSEVGALFEAHAHPKRALELVQAALTLSPKSVRLLRHRARLELSLDRVQEAMASLEAAIEQAADANARTSAIEELLRVARKSKKGGALLSRVEVAVKKGVDRVAPYLVLARAAARARDPGRAQHALEALLKVRPGQIDAHRELARLAERQGEFDLALKHLLALEGKRGAPQRQIYEDMARVHLQRYDRKAALACYRRILAAAPSNPAAFKEVAKAYEKIGMVEEARRCLRQAVRLKPKDGRTRLELARLLEQLGERTLATEEILAATAVEDRPVRKKARKAYYRALASRGTVETEIAALRRRCLDNPYDVQAPLTLIDLYVRELEYEPALELVDTLLGYQPKQPDLLEQRARLCVLLERHEDAIGSLETLWRLPKADRQRLSLRIADAAILSGDLDRAERSLSGVRDPVKVARLYRKHDLPERAQQVLTEGIRRTPQDARLHARLARITRDIGERDTAVKSMEAVIALKGARWERLNELGALYHELDRKDDVLRIGRRLFAKVRRDPPPKTDKEKEDAEEDDESEANVWRQRRQASYRQRYRTRLRTLQKFFEQRGVRLEFLKVGASEWRLQPSNDLLLSQLVNAAKLEQAPLALELLDEAEKHNAADRRPNHLTQRAWGHELRRMRARLYRSETKLRRERAKVLAAELDELSPTQAVELLTLYDLDQRHDDLAAALVKLRQRLPDDPRLALADAQRHERAERYAEAIPGLRAALVALDGRAKSEASERARRLKLRFRLERTNLRQGFPLRVQARIDSASLRRLFRLTHDEGESSSWTMGSDPNVAGVALALARCAEKSKQPEVARAALQRLRPTDPDALPAWSRLAVGLFKRDFKAEGASVCLLLRAKEAELSSHAVLGLNRRWVRWINQPMTRWARVLEKSGQWVEAYELLRSYGDAGAGRLLLQEHKALELARDHYVKKLAAARAALARKDPAAPALVRNTGIKLAEVHQFAGRWDAALKTYEGLLADLPEAWDLYVATARLHERAGRDEATVAVYRRAIKAKRARRQRPPSRPAPEGRVLEPVAPDGLADGETHWAWSNLRWATSYNSDKTNVGREYAAILKLYLTRRKVTKAAATLRQIAREDARTFRWLGWTLSTLVRDYRLGPAGLPVMRLLWGVNKRDAWLGMEVARSLVANDELREASQILRRVQARAGSSKWIRDQARELMGRVERRLGKGKRKTLAELRAAVEKRPKQAKPRAKLVRRLFEERRFEAALTEAKALLKVAPHLAEARRLLEQCLLLRGTDAELLAHLRAEVKRAKPGQERFGVLLRMVNVVAKPGPKPGAEAEKLLKEAEKSSGSPPQNTVSNWWVERGEVVRARALLESIRDRTPPGNWMRQRVDERLLEVAIAEGSGGVAWKIVGKRLEEAGQRGQRYDVYLKVLTALAAEPPVEAKRKGLLAGTAKLPPARAALYRALVHLSVRDLQAGERELAAAFKADPEGTRWVFPLYLELAYARRDFKAALARLDELDKSGATGTDTVRTNLGNLRERDLLRACRGEVLLRLGREEDALATWAKIVDSTRPETRLAHARILAENERWEPACEALRAYLKKKGERVPDQLRWLAAWEERRGSPESSDVALKVLRRARTLALGKRKDWMDPLKKIEMDLHGLQRRTGTLGDLRAKLAARRAADPNDSAAAEGLVKVLAELGERDALRALLEELSKTPAKAPGVFELLANEAQREGRLADAAAALGKEQGGQEWDNRRRTQRWARLLARAGRPISECLAVLRKGYEDPVGRQAQQGILRFCRQERAWPEALAALDVLRGLEPPTSVRQAHDHARLLIEVGRPRAALEQMWRLLASPNGLQVGESLGGEILHLEDTVAAVTTQAGIAPVASTASASDRALRVAILARLRGQHAAAIAASKLLLQKDARHLPARWNLMQALAAKGDLRAALVEAATLRVALEREAAAGSLWSNPLNTLRSLEGEWHLRLGAKDATFAAWRRPLGGRFRSLSIWRYTIYNRPDIPTIWRVARSHHLYDLALSELRRGSVWERANSLPSLLLRGGKSKEALELAWRKVRDPLSGVLRGQNRGGGSQLVNLAFEAGVLDETLAELRRLYSADPAQMASLRDPIARALRLVGRTQEALTFRRATAPWDAAWDTSELNETGELLERTGKWAEALPLARRLQSIERSQNAAFRSGSSSILSRRSGGGALRFRWSGSNTQSGGTVYYSNSNGPGGIGGIRQAERRVLGLLAATGDHAARAPLEARWLSSALDRGGAKLELAQRYAEVKQWALAEKLALASLAPVASGTADSEERDLEVWSLLARWRTKAGHSAQAGEALRAWHGASRGYQELHPYEVSRRVQRVSMLLEYDASNVAEIHSEIAAIRRARPRSHESWTLSGWASLRSGDLGVARKTLEKARTQAAAEGEGLPRDWVSAWALLLDAEGHSDAPRWLRRALVGSGGRGRGHWAESELRAALGLPPD
jgi:Tfp pilus assembly protein PilF